MPKAIPAGHSVREAWERLLAWLPSPRIETIPIRTAAGRVLAEPLIAPVELPRFRRAMMDGFAVIAADPNRGKPPVELRIVGRSRPTEPHVGPVAAGEAVAIATGAPVPAECDAVVPIEFCTVEGDVVRCLTAIPPGKHVGLPGEDVTRGQTLLEPGRRLRPQDVALASSLGIGSVAVLARPRVRIVVAGDEILPAGSLPEGFRVVDANGPLLTALALRDGGLPQPTGILPDDPAILRAALSPTASLLPASGPPWPECDLIVTAGGSSAGPEDHLPNLVAELGELPIRGLALRPGGPAAIGRIGTVPVVLLPGQPTACLVAYDLLVGPAIRLLGGLPLAWPYEPVAAVAAERIPSATGRLDYIRVRLADGKAIPLPGGASRLSTVTQADGFVLVPPGTAEIPAGFPVTVHRYEPQAPADARFAE